MYTLRIKLLQGLDRVVGLALAGLLLGTSLAFGGAVWWGRLATIGLTFAMVLAWLARSALAGPWRILKSPITALGLMAIGLGIVQLLPLPTGIVARISPRSASVASNGVIPDKARFDDPSAEILPPFLSRSPMTLDRPATLRWLAGAITGLALFWVASHFCDRFTKAQAIWGSVVAAFFVNVILGAVQVTSLSSGLYGSIAPGQGQAWSPTIDDAMSSPSESILRPVGEPKAGRPAMVATRMVRPFLVGTMMGGPGALLALGSLALPLSLGMALQMLAPRGTRDGLMARLRDSGQGSLAVLILGLTFSGSVLVGVLAGRMPSLTFGAGLIITGLAGSWIPGARRVGLAITVLMLAALGAGVAIGDLADRGNLGLAPLPRVDWSSTRATWNESLPILHNFPVVGTGLGTFEAVYPYYKTRDAAPNTAMSSVLQYAVESGAVGLGLLATAGLWCLIRLPGAIGRVGSADRALAFGLLGALVGFGLFSAIHWTVELSAVALAACAVAGTANRWLAGGTDLFVDHG